jgi:coniferyl-aldehyde dehydrogenase
VPWNFPINLLFSQLAAIFAAGNRAMVKMSENSLKLSAILKELCGNYFAPEKLQIFEETGAVGIEFSKIPFDHLIFTGSGATGRKVMAAAAQNLTPVTLELGGKCPAIIDSDYVLDKAVERIMFVKQFNAGQICTCVDYVFVHKSQVEEFVTKAKAWVNKHIPDILAKDYTSIIDERSYQRLQQTIEDAQQRGARVINLTEQQGNAEKRKLPVTLVLDSSDDMLIRNRETFGPLLMVLPYESPEEVINYVNAKDRPLAIYPFTKCKALQELYISKIMSGGVTVNDALFHVGQHDLPFGGVGGSGMGHYHGYDGFLTFSKLRPVMYQANITSGKLLAPPYASGWANKITNALIRLKSKI